MGRVAYLAGAYENVRDEYTIDANQKELEVAHDQCGIRYQSARLLSNTDSRVLMEHGKYGDGILVMCTGGYVHAQ